MLRYVILGFLQGADSRHGYELTTEYRARTGIKLNVGNVYRELSQLAQNGFVVAVNGEREAGGRRIPYRITNEGRAVFDRWLLTRPASPDEFVHRIPFLDRLPSQTRESLLDEFESHLVVRSQLLREEMHHVGEPVGSDRGSACHVAVPLLLQRRMKQLQLELDFLKIVRISFGRRITAPPPRAKSSRPGRRRARAVR